MRFNTLGKDYADGEIIVRKGDVGESMYIVIKGEVEVCIDSHDLTDPASSALSLGTLGPGEFFGEMSLFTGRPRSATVRAKGAAKVMTIDKRGFFKRVHQDPSLAFNLLRKLCGRLESLDEELARQRGKGDGAPPES